MNVHILQMMEKYLENLSNLILQEMESKNYTILEFAVKCGVSPRKISDIKNRKVNNISLKTLIKICETYHFSYADIFDCWNQIDEEIINSILSKFILTNGNSRYLLKKSGSK